MPQQARRASDKVAMSRPLCSNSEAPPRRKLCAPVPVVGPPASATSWEARRANWRVETDSVRSESAVRGLQGQGPKYGRQWTRRPRW